MPFAFIADHSSVFITLGLLGLIASLGYIVYVLQQPKVPAKAPASSVRPKPNTQTLAALPTATEANRPTPPSRSVPVRPAGTSKGDQNQVPTEQVPAIRVPPAPPAATVVSDVQRKAERMAELGFHHSVNKDVVEVKSPEPAKAIGAAPAPVVAAAAPVVAATAAAPAGQPPASELDDILSRIDKVLAENPVMAVNTLGSSSEPGTATQTENWLEITQDEMPGKPSAPNA